MEIIFEIKGRDGKPLTEAQALAELEAGTPPSDEAYLFGWMRWRDAGQLDLSFNDDLSMLFPDCLGAVANLRAQGRAEMSMASYYCHLTLITLGDHVLVLQEDSEIEGKEVARYPKDTFIDALAACCRRFAVYVQALAELDPRWAGLHDDMAESSA
jgi:hypothetical protein